MNDSTSGTATSSSELTQGLQDFDPISHLPDAVAPYLQDTLESIENYAREKPWSFGLWMVGLGFVIGWKLKPW